MDDGSAQPDREVLDIVALAELADQLDEGFDGLMQRFRRRLTETPAAIRVALEADEREELMREAHSLKSVAATFGAVAVSRASAELEEVAEKAPQEKLEELVGRLDRECEAAGAALRQAGL